MANDLEKMEYVIECAIDFIEQNELQSSRMEVGEYDTLIDALKALNRSE